MTTASSQLTVAGVEDPIVQLDQMHRLGRAALIISRSQFDTAVAQERTRISVNGFGLYPAGQSFRIVGEEGTRIWTLGVDSASSHARVVEMRPGLRLTLTAESNTVTTVSGTPSGGLNGDVKVDYATNSVYTKASDVWGAAQLLYPSGNLDIDSLPVATMPLLGTEKLVLTQSGLAKSIAASLVGDGGVATQNYIPFTGGQSGSVVTSALQAVCDAADLVGVPVRLPGWDVRIGGTITCNQMIGTWGLSRLLIDGAFTYTGFANQFIIINRNFSQGFNFATAPQVRYEDFDVYLVPQNSNRGRAMIGLGGVRRGRIAGLRLTAVPNDDGSGNPVPVGSLLDIYCTARNIEVYGNEFRNVTGAWGDHGPVGPDGGACIWVRNLRGGLATDKELYVTQDINIHHNYFEHLTSDECLAVYGVKGITRRVQVHHNIFKGLATTADKVYNGTFISFFPLNDGSGAELGNTAAVYDCEFAHNYVESQCTLYELLRIGNSSDANNYCYNNQSKSNKYWHNFNWNATTGAVAAWVSGGSVGVSPADASVAVRVIEGNVGTGYRGAASGNTSSDDTVWHFSDGTSILSQGWAGVQSVSNPTCYGSLATGLSNCRSVQGGQVEAFARTFYNCQSVVGTEWRVNGQGASFVAFDVDAADGSNYVMQNTKGLSQGGLVRVGALVLEQSRVNLYNNTAIIYSNTLEPSISRVAISYQGQAATLTLRLNEISGSITTVNAGPDRRLNLFVGSSAPTAETDWDLWIDTSSTPVLKRWLTPVWAVATSRVGAATVLAQGAAEAGGDNRLNVYVMATPDGTPAEGDYQCKQLEGYKWYRYTSGSWVATSSDTFPNALLSVAGVGRVRRSLNNWAGVED